MDNSSNLNELKAFTNCFINTDTPGYDSIANDPKGVTHEALCGTEFYTNEMRLSQDVWDLSDVAGTGTPSLKTMPEEDVRAPETAPTREEYYAGNSSGRIYRDPNGRRTARDPRQFG